MKRIQWLSLSDNRLSGSIPWEVSFLNRSLAYLYLYNNKLSGALSSFIGNLVNLEELDLSNNSLLGKITPQLGKCEKLLYLSLAWNKFSGTIPSEVVNLKHIQTRFDLSCNWLRGDVPAEIGGLNMAEHIDLSQNQLEGDIGLWIDQWLNAQYINLSFNNFSGELPKSIAKNLTQLQFLDVSNNNFTGSIPESLFNLSHPLKLNVSYNNFWGRVPCSPAFANRSNFSFAYNLQLCGDCLSLPKCKSHKRQSPFYHSLVLSCVLIGVALIFSLCIVLLILRRKFTTSSTCMEMRRHFLWVTLEEIQAATQNFSTTNIIGRGRHGIVYKGTLQEGEEVAVKVFSVSDSSETSDSMAFIRECETLGQVRHRNLMKIITACSTIHFKALILPLMPNSLHKLLHEENVNVTLLRTLFNLQIRLRILQDLAAALSYLHQDCSPCIVHCDVKPQNVLLDEEMTVHLSDFGIARLLHGGFASNSSPTAAAFGSPGYIAPEYGTTGMVSTKGDVYSFGIVILEVLTGLMPTDPMFEGDLTLSKWISKEFPQNLENKEESIERMKRLVGKGRRGVEREIREEEEWRAVEELMKVAMMCTSERAEQRPSMRDVQGMLYSISSNLYENQSENESENENNGIFLGKRKECRSFEIFLQRIESVEREQQLKKKNEMHQESISSSY